MKFFLNSLGALFAAVFMVVWTAFAVMLYGAHSDYWWDSRCLPGHPWLANGQALLTVAGLAIGFYAIVRQRPREFGVACACFVAWLGFLVAWAALPDRDYGSSCPIVTPA